MTQVAVYGSLRQGMGNHGRLRGATYVGTTVTTQPYAMFSLGGFPMVSLGLAKTPIVVEIYDCNEEQLEGLDYLEGYRGEGKNNFYDRSTVMTEAFGEALIYHIEHRQDYSPEVTSGDWVQFYTKRA